MARRHWSRTPIRRPRVEAADDADRPRHRRIVHQGHRPVAFGERRITGATLPRSPRAARNRRRHADTARPRARARRPADPEDGGPRQHRLGQRFAQPARNTRDDHCMHVFPLGLVRYFACPRRAPRAALSAASGPENRCVVEQPRPASSASHPGSAATGSGSSLRAARARRRRSHRGGRVQRFRDRAGFAGMPLRRAAGSARWPSSPIGCNALREQSVPDRQRAHSSGAPRDGSPNAARQSCARHLAELGVRARDDHPRFVHQRRRVAAPVASVRGGRGRRGMDRVERGPGPRKREPRERIEKIVQVGLAGRDLACSSRCAVRSRAPGPLRRGWRNEQRASVRQRQARRARPGVQRRALSIRLDPSPSRIRRKAGCEAHRAAPRESAPAPRRLLRRDDQRPPPRQRHPTRARSRRR